MTMEQDPQVATREALERRPILEHIIELNRQQVEYRKEQIASGASGVKYDIGKPEFGLIPPHAMLEMVKVLTAGAQKYSRDNWIKVPGSKRRYFDAMERHVWAWKRGELYDQDDGIHHLAHAACCLFFLYEIDVIYNGGVPDGEDK